MLQGPITSIDGDSLAVEDYNTPELQQVSFSEYRSWLGVNHHFLESFRVSPKRAHYERENPADPTSAFFEGQYNHHFCLESASVDEEYAVLPADFDGRTKAGKELKATIETTGKRAVTHDQHARALAMNQVLRAHPEASQIFLSNTLTEVSAQWECQHGTGLPRKSRLDAVCLDTSRKGQPYDLKFVADASYHSFVYGVRRYGWARQAAYYMDALEACGVEAPDYRFILIEKQPPHACCVYVIGARTLAEARKENVETLKAYKLCAEAGVWPDFHGGKVRYVELVEEQLYADEG